MTHEIQLKSKNHASLPGIGNKGDDVLSFDIPSGNEFVRCEITFTGKAYPGAYVVEQPAVGEVGNNKSVKVHWYYDGNVPANNIIGHAIVANPHIDYTVKFITQTSVSAVNMDQRALLVVNNITQGGAVQLSFLYTALDNLFPMATTAVLGNNYAVIQNLTGNNATFANFKQQLQVLGASSGITALDVFLLLHGLNGSLFFGNQNIPTSNIKNDLMGINLNDKLRWLYSLACFGASHAQDFIDGGFKVVEGALEVNANGTYDFPAQIRKWENGGTVEQAVNAGNNITMMRIHDTVAEATLAHLGMNYSVNSMKIIRGIKSTTISSSAS